MNTKYFLAAGAVITTLALALKLLSNTKDLCTVTKSPLSFIVLNVAISLSPFWYNFIIAIALDWG
ncbi:hypothetical protein JGE20_25125 [Salmonella enterica subsp. enterica serovar Typhimurium]|nr:hypothetical protein [Salmonella enterica subsp. enterica serovar Typhimurium]